MLIFIHFFRSVSAVLMRFRYMVSLIDHTDTTLVLYHDGEHSQQFTLIVYFLRASCKFARHKS